MNVLQYLLSLVVPLLPPFLIHMELKPGYGSQVTIDRNNIERNYKPRSTFINELPMAFFTNTVWGLTFVISGLSQNDIHTWNAIYIVLGCLEIGLMISSKKRIKNWVYFLFTGLLAISVVLLTIKRIQSPSF